MTIAWVLGSRGLLGSALARRLARDSQLFVPAARFSWHDASQLAAEIEAAVQAFAERVGTAQRWEIYWAAGVGTMSSPAEALAPETKALSLLLQCLEGSSQLMAVAGGVTQASTAGAIYAGSSDAIISEATTPAPTTDYAREKLEQEAMVQRFAKAHEHTTALIARISTLYGPGQAAGKKQGLLTHLARSMLRNKPVQIFVPFDTIRDYITADDAAAVMVEAFRRITRQERVLIKIVASERPTTIAEIVSTFRRMARRAPRIVTSASRLSSVYARRVEFRSIVPADPPNRAPTPLAIGIAELMAAERLAFMRNPDAPQG